MTSSSPETDVITTNIADGITLKDGEFETAAENDSTNNVTSSSKMTTVSSTYSNLVTSHKHQTPKVMTSYIEVIDISTTISPDSIRGERQKPRTTTDNLSSSVMTSSSSDSIFATTELQDDEEYQTTANGVSTSGVTSSSRITSIPSTVSTTDDLLYSVLTTTLSLSEPTNELAEISTTEDLTMAHGKYQTMVDDASTSSVTLSSSVTSLSTTPSKVVTSQTNVKAPDDETIEISAPVLAVWPKCSLPTMARFRRTIYRPYFGPRTNSYTAGSVINSGAIIVAICKSDVIGDLITKRVVSKCRNGRWQPKLPKCIVKRRCKAPPVVENATPSENVSPYQTFPHAALITYSCGKGKMATGNSTMVCDNGRWIKRNFKYNPNVQQSSDLRDKCLNYNVMNGRVSIYSVTLGFYRVTCDEGYRLMPRHMYRCNGGKWMGTVPKCIRVKPNIQDIPEQNNDNCLNIDVINGRVSTNSVTNGFYSVTCNKGYQLIPTQKFKCNRGKWMGTVPKCVRAAANCRLPVSARRMSYFRSTKTGRIVNPRFVDHLSEIVQICKRRKTSPRKVKCVNGRWRPTLMTCYSDRLYRHSGHLRHRRSMKKERQRRLVNTCTIPEVKGGPSHFTISGTITKLPVNHSVQDGLEVQRKCLDGGFMILPGVQIMENITSKCHHGNWTPEFPRCLRDIKDTVFYDDLQDETTTQSTLPSTTTTTTTKTTENMTPGPASSAETTVPSTNTEQPTSRLTTTTAEVTTQVQSSLYRIHVSGDLPKYIFINEPSFFLELENNELSTRARNVGTIKMIRFGNTVDWGKSSLYPSTSNSFVSIYMNDNGIDKFYIEKYVAGNQEMRAPPCARFFQDTPKFIPDWNKLDRLGIKEFEYDHCQDLISCKIKCIEHKQFDCKAAYFSKVLNKNHCVVYEKAIPIERAKTENYLITVTRNDTCTTP